LCRENKISNYRYQGRIRIQTGAKISKKMSAAHEKNEACMHLIKYDTAVTVENECSPRADKARFSKKQTWRTKRFDSVQQAVQSM
jgi:hypothetical protein